MYRSYARLPFVAAALALLVPALPAHAYRIMRTPHGAEVHWPTFRHPVSYRIHHAGSADITDGSDLTAVQASVQTWQDVQCTSIAFERGPDVTGTGRFSCSDGVSMAFWIESNWPADVGGEALGVATPCYNSRSGELFDADVWFNGVYYQWATDGSRNRVDVQNIATHEFGHFLGIGHSEFPDATMYYASGGNGETFRRTLANDDRAAVCYLYPTDCVSDGDCAGTDICVRNRCQPEPPPPSGLGEECQEDQSCVTGTGNDQAMCLSEAEYDFPGGYCITLYCGPDSPCPEGGECLEIGEDGEGNMVSACFAGCGQNLDCREDYICASLQSGESVCYPGCTNDDDCGEYFCDTTSGYCSGHRNDTANVGDPCTTNEQCPTGGGCLDEAQAGFPGGYCTKLCDGTPCPDGSSCFTFQTEDGPIALCLDDCAPGSTGECRDGYACWPTGNRDSETGAEVGACWIACEDDTHCSNDGSLVCNAETGLCEPPREDDPENGGGENGGGENGGGENGGGENGGGENGEENGGGGGGRSFVPSCGGCASGVGSGAAWPAFLLALVALLRRRAR